MDIEWINVRYKEANRKMDSDWEVSQWVDSLYPDFYGCLIVNLGYATPDYKVHSSLVEHLPKWASNNKSKIRVNTSNEVVDGEIIYKVWITPLDEFEPLS
ncbi:hypothetical protein [Cohnella sp. WQ 127256]|uniref:hypothetical protein n=1 Tax=Cohnella sp. WQ 127256 TaxID=2938790 RepID=UPI0021173F1F|nr:hypothetical protein [Cohnella sp. WQ 127256]